MPSQSIAPPKEKQLLVCCARTRIDPIHCEKMRDLVKQKLDWDYLLSEASEDSVTPLLARNLLDAVVECIPQSQKEELHVLARGNTARSLFLAGELLKLLGAFASARVEAVPYKGPVLAAQAYGDSTLREFDDLDIVLRQSDLRKAHDVMLELGYRPRFDWILRAHSAAALIPGEYNYRDEARGVLVELHTERTLRHFPCPPELDRFFSGLVTVELNGRDVRTFSPEDGLTLLSVHGAKDFWERLIWMADIAQLVQASTSLDWDAVFRRAQESRAVRILHLALALAADPLEAPLPGEILRRVQQDEMALRIAGQVRRRFFARKFVPLGAFGLLQFRRRMILGYLPGWRYALRLAAIPVEEDRLRARMPRSLAPLYMVLRPFRLLKKYAWAGHRAAGPSP